MQVYTFSYSKAYKGERTCNGTIIIADYSEEAATKQAVTSLGEQLDKISLKSIHDLTDGCVIFDEDY